LYGARARELFTLENRPVQLPRGFYHRWSFIK